ncbi:hypothetical protein ACXZ65_14560 [Streptomyces aculeolatus]
MNAAELIEGYTAYASPEDFSSAEIADAGNAVPITTMNMAHTTQITTFVAD